MNQTVIMFKCLNGEEVIARLVDETDEEYTIEKARLLVAQRDQAKPGQMTIGLVPWYLGAPDGTVDVKKSAILSRLRIIPSELEKGYLHQTSTIDLSGII